MLSVNVYPAAYLPYRRKWFIGQSQQKCFVQFIEAIMLER
jgi:hypothetical protein